MMYPLLLDARRFDNLGINRRADKYKPRSADLQPPKHIVSDIAAGISGSVTPAFQSEKLAAVICHSQENPLFYVLRTWNSNIWILAQCA